MFVILKILFQFNLLSSLSPQNVRICAAQTMQRRNEQIGNLRRFESSFRNQNMKSNFNLYLQSIPCYAKYWCTTNNGLKKMRSLLQVRSEQAIEELQSSQIPLPVPYYILLFNNIFYFFNLNIQRPYMILEYGHHYFMVISHLYAIVHHLSLSQLSIFRMR